MANTPAAQHVSKVSGAGNQQVFPLLGGINTGSKDGEDVGTGGPAVAGVEVPPTSNLVIDRVVEFLDDRYVLCANGQNGNLDSGVYKKNQGGAGQWGRVQGGSVSNIANSTFKLDSTTTGLYVLHPDGAPTLFYMMLDANNNWRIWRTTDGLTGANWGTGTGTQVEVNTTGPLSFGQSIVFKDSLVHAHSYYADGAAGNGSITQYDLKTGVLTRYDLSAIYSSTGASAIGLLVLDGVLYASGLRTGAAPNLPILTKLSGGVFSTIVTVTGHKTNSGNAHAAMFKDTATGDLIWLIPGRSDPANIEGTSVARIQNPAGAATYSDISVTVFGAVEGADKYLPGNDPGSETRRYSISVDTISDPTAPRTYFSTWIPGGSTETWEWKGVAAEVEAVGLLAGISDAHAWPYNTVGGGHRSPSIARISIGDVANPPVEVVGGTKTFFRGSGSAPAGTLTFRGIDSQGAPITVVPISPGSLTIGPGLFTKLEAYYHFDDFLTDASGNALDLTLSGTVPYAAGRFGNGANFSGAGIDSAKRTIDDASLNLGVALAPYAVSCWVIVDALAGISVIAGVDSGWQLRVQADGTLESFGGATASSALGTIVPGASLQHLIVNSDAVTGLTKVYLDGVEVASVTTLANTNSVTPFRVGLNHAGGQGFNGVVDDLAIWSRALSLTEIGYLYNSGAGFLLEGATPFLVTPSISGNTIINLLPDESNTLYSVVLDTGAAGVGIDEGETGLLIAELI